jgi:hypothetical protein
MKLPEAVAAYVAYKQSLGMRFATEARTLQSFYRTLGDIDMREVSADRVYAFLPARVPSRPSGIASSVPCAASTALPLLAATRPFRHYP